MGQRPIAIRIKVAKPYAAHDEHVVMGVAEAARRLAVSERTVYRMLKMGLLERANAPPNSDVYDSILSDISEVNTAIPDDKRRNIVAFVSDKAAIHGSQKPVQHIENLERQLAAKDAQIAQLLNAQQELTQTVRRLQEQMYELAHLVLTHNAAAAQAKAEAELKAQQLQQAQAKSGGLAGLLGNRGRKG